MTRKRRNDEDTDDDDEVEKKERVIHTRVPESLETQLRAKAQDLGISVSNLVRNVLGHAFGLVGDVVADSHAIARTVRGEKKQPPATPASGGMSGVSDGMSGTSGASGGMSGASGGMSGASGGMSGASAMSPMSIDDVIGWQYLVLNKNAVCAKCNAILARGKEAAVGVGTQIVICLNCEKELRA